MSTLGEVAAAFIGFSLVAGVLRPQSTSGMRRFFRFRHVAEIALGALLSAFLPLLIHAYGATNETTWFVASAILLLPGVVAPIASWREVGLSASYNAEPTRTVATVALNVAVVILLLWNVVLADPSSGARYATFVVALLALAGLVFIGATFGSSEEPPAV